ncbi:unnamed protein product [Sphenostylis stenocarpa]|uniref:Uncharacterized protein n=1 Tax=Sphenostylis stenocarpa TaxID=92480 RepID=A0AA86VYR2_9FABA|nr:unnamed protein product [Sphenostylis stenocarpa]
MSCGMHNEHAKRRARIRTAMRGSQLRKGKPLKVHNTIDKAKPLRLLAHVITYIACEEPQEDNTFVLPFSLHLFFHNITMEDPLGSILNFHQSCDELKQNLLATTLELETMKNVNKELINQLKMAYKERDEAREELQKLVKKLTSPTLVEKMIPTPTKSSITESNSPSHVSSPVDSLLDAVSPREFSNLNIIVDSHNNMAYHLKQPLVQNTRVSQRRTCDVGDEVIEHLAKRRTLPQKGMLLKAVVDAGPLLKTLLVAGPLPTWRNPPSSQTIETPCLNVQDIGSNNVNTFNSLQKPTLAFASSRSLQPSVLNVSVSNNNALQMGSNATCKNLAPSRIPQGHQYLL